MAVYIEVVKARDETPVDGAVVRLEYTDGTSEEAVTKKDGMATFARSGAFTVAVNGQVYPSQVELEDEETLTVPLDGATLPRWRRLKKIRLSSLNPNPFLPANQPSQRQVSLHVQTPISFQRRRPVFNLGLVIDCSSSMVGDKIYTAIEAVGHLLQRLRPDDQVAVVTFNQSAELILPGRKLNTAARDELLERLRQPVLADQSNLHAGWQAGAGQVADHRGEQTLNWILLFTDGLVDAGVTGRAELIAQAQAWRQQGISTYIFGLGDDADHELLQAIAEAGGGQFHPVERPEQFPDHLQRWLGRLEAALQIGREAVVELTTPDLIQVDTLLPLPLTRQGQTVRIWLGEVYTGQVFDLPLQLHLPAHPAGQTIYLPVDLHYHDAQNYPLPVVVRTLPISFVVQGESRPEEPDQADTPSPRTLPQPQLATVQSWLTPLSLILSGGVLFLIAAFVVVGTLLLMPAQNVPAPAANQVAPPTVVAVVSTATEPIISPPLPTAIPPTLPPPPTSVATAVDKLILPTATLSPTVAATPTPTATPIAAPQPARPVEGRGIGQIAPDFTLGSNRASRVSLSDLRGKIVILNFWTTWCPYSTREVPDLQALHNEYGPQGVVVLAINQGETLQNVERFAQNNGVSFAVWLDEDKWAGNVYQVSSYPTTYFIDRDGIVRAIFQGAMTRDDFVRELKKLLG